MIEIDDAWAMNTMIGHLEQAVIDLTDAQELISTIKKNLEAYESAYYKGSDEKCSE